MDEVIREFLIESSENLGRLDQELVLLEQSPKDAQLLASVFRTMHTIKETGGMLGYSAVEGLAHLAENLLSQLRNGERDLTPALVSLILRTVDAIKGKLQAIETSGKESGTAYNSLKDDLKQAGENKETPAPVPAENKTAAPPASQPDDSANVSKNL